MGISIYYYIVVLIILFGMILPQKGNEKKYYIILMTIIHTFVCGFRYKYLTGDLLKYNTEYQDVRFFGYFSERVIHEWKNTGFYWLMKLISDITNGNFQVFLFIIALFIEVVVAILIYRYSTKPWLSYLIWNCIGFYVFGFSAIKQALAMALIMCAMMCILEDNFKEFIVFVLLAGFVHMPAIAFLPAYWLAKRRVHKATIRSYIVATCIIYIFKNQILTFISNIYYDEKTTELFQQNSSGLGGRFFMIVLVLICGILLKGFCEKRFENLFNMIVIAGIFQMFSGFDNVFTRFADYYFQFAVIFIPMIFNVTDEHTSVNQYYLSAALPFDRKSLQILTIFLTAVLIWYYYYTCLSVTISNPVDDYLNFRFMWDVAG